MLLRLPKGCRNWAGIHRAQPAGRVPLECAAKQTASGNTLQKFRHSSPDVVVAYGGAHAAAVQQAARYRADRISWGERPGPQPARSQAWPGRVGLLRFHRNGFRYRRQMARATQADSARRYPPSGFFAPANIGGVGQLGAIQGAASSLGWLSPVDLRDVAGFDRAIATFARSLESAA